jgi:hypothetical protein
MRAMLISRWRLLPPMAMVIGTLVAPPALGQSNDPKKAAPPAKPGPPAAHPAEAEQHGEAPKEEEEKETHRAIFFSADLGFTRTDLGGISNNLDFEKTAANGILYGFAAGLRQKDMRYGIRWRVYDTTEYALWSFMGTIGYGLPLRPISPVFSLNVGYVWDQKIQQGALQGTLPRGTVLPPDVDVRGLLVGLDVNASYWITRFLRLGVFIGADFMLLHRLQANLPVAVPPITPQERQHPLFTEDGSGFGFNVNAGLRGAFDIAF